MCKKAVQVDRQITVMGKRTLPKKQNMVQGDNESVHETEQYSAC